MVGCGRREPRLRGDAYFNFMDEVVQGIQVRESV